MVVCYLHMSSKSLCIWFQGNVESGRGYAKVAKVLNIVPLTLGLITIVAVAVNVSLTASSTSRVSSGYYGNRDYSSGAATTTEIAQWPVGRTLTHNMLFTTPTTTPITTHTKATASTSTACIILKPTAENMKLVWTKIFVHWYIFAFSVIYATNGYWHSDVRRSVVTVQRIYRGMANYITLFLIHTTDYF